MLSDIKPLYKSVKKGIQGGAEDIGSFSEGECFKVIANKLGSEVNWIMCCETLAEKTEWMNILMALKG